MWYMNEFHSNGVIPKGYNSSFITLIPKLEDPQNLGEFRPISLVGCMYKILTKVLARKVKKVHIMLLMASKVPSWKKGISYKVYL